MVLNGQECEVLEDNRAAILIKRPAANYQYLILTHTYWEDGSPAGLMAAVAFRSEDKAREAFAARTTRLNG